MGSVLCLESEVTIAQTGGLSEGGRQARGDTFGRYAVGLGEGRPIRIHQCYLPYDAPYAVEKFFRQTQPTIGIIMETEVWPNLMSNDYKA